MAFKLITLALACSLLSLSYASVYPSYACYKAYNKCDFRFAGHNTLPTFSINGPADVAFTPRIISKKDEGTLGILNSNNITPEFIKHDYSVTPINHVYAKQKLTPTHFKPYTIKKTPFSGIGHQTFHQDQKAVSTGKCVRVWFSEYQLLKSVDPHKLKENKNNVPKSENKCVVFFTN